MQAGLGACTVILLSLYNNLINSDLSRFKWTLRTLQALLPCSELFSGNTPVPQGLVWDEKLSKRVTKEARALAGTWFWGPDTPRRAIPRQSTHRSPPVTA